MTRSQFPVAGGEPDQHAEPLSALSSATATPRATSQAGGASLPVDPADPVAGADPWIGRTISDRYRVVDVLAKGGMSTVYRGEHVHMLKPVAIKMLDAKAERLPELVERFQREAIAGAHIRHPNIASATDFGQLEDGSYFLVLEYVPGTTLTTLAGRPMAPERARRIARQVAEALAAAHDLSIVHRDVKPSNIMVSEDGSDLVKLIDFGFAQVRVEKMPSIPPSLARPQKVDALLTAAGVVFGTVSYMAPEAALGMAAVDARSDLYALGVVLYELLAGCHPFEGSDPVELFLQQRTLPPPPIATRGPSAKVPPALEAVVVRLLAKDPNERYQSAREVVAALDGAAMSDAMGKLQSALGLGEVASAPASVPPPQSKEPELVAYAGETRSLRDWARTAGDSLRTAQASTEAWARSVTSRLGPQARSLWSTIRQAPPNLRVLWVGGLAALVAALALTLTVGLRPRREPRASLTPASPAPAVQELRQPAAAAPDPGGLEPAPARPKVEVDTEAYTTSIKGAAKARDWAVGASLVAPLLERDPEALRDRELRAAVTTCVTGLAQTNEQQAEDVLESLGRAGPGGLDALWEIARARPRSKTTKRASDILRRPETLDGMSRELRIASDLSEASCSAKRQLFGRAAAEGDERALFQLLALREHECTRWHDPCCFKDSRELGRAISGLRSRIGSLERSAAVDIGSAD